MARIKTFEDKMRDMLGEDYDNTFVTEEVVEAISTGALSLDASIGVGGIPRGRFTTLSGPEGSGKSTIALSVAREALNAGIKVNYVDVENQMFLSYIEELIGVSLKDNKNFVISKPRNSDEAFVIVEEAIDSKEFGLIILDSVAALSPPEEQAKKFEEGNMAITPRDLAKFFRRTSFKVRENNIAFLFVNQIRDNIGSYVKSYSMPGGHAILHWSSVLIPISKAEEIKAGDEVIGIMTKFTIKKNKVAPPFRSFLIPIIFGKGVDSFRDLVRYAEFLGVIRKGGPYYKFEEQTLGRGMLETMEYLSDSPEMLEKIKSDCYKTIANKGKVDDEEGEEGDA